MKLPADHVVLDGEIVGDSFVDLQSRLIAKRATGLSVGVFDLLRVEGRDMRRAPLGERQGALFDLLDARADPRLCMVEAFDDGAELLAPLNA